MFDFKHYKENVNDIVWKRAHSITISNPLDQTPRVTFEEQLVSKVGDDVLSQHAGILGLQINEATANEEIALLDQDGNDTGAKVNIGQIATALFSAYIYFANVRDERESGGESLEITPSEDPS